MTGKKDEQNALIQSIMQGFSTSSNCGPQTYKPDLPLGCNQQQKFKLKAIYASLCGQIIQIGSRRTTLVVVYM